MYALCPPVCIGNANADKRNAQEGWLKLVRGLGLGKGRRY